MPTPNWGPQAGVPMDDATFNNYLAGNPPPNATAGSNPFTWNGQGTGYTPESVTAANDPTNSPTVQGNNYWSSFYSGGPASVQTPAYNTTNQDQARLQQQQAIQDLQNQANGSLNTRAQGQLTQSYGDANQQQSSLASTMRGQSAGAAMRGAQQGQDSINRGFAGDQQMLKLQEMQAAQALQAQLLAQQQGQDIAQAQGMAGAQNSNAALEEAMRQFYAQQGSAFDVERGQIAQERQRAQFGFDLEGNDITNRFLQQGVNALGTAAAAYGSQGNNSTSQFRDAAKGNGYDVQSIDDSFDNG